jgi:AcrR family transcriptional regulator
MSRERRAASPPPLRRPGRPKGATSDATRARILSAARVCFARKGYVGTTNADIATVAGVTAAALYQYFDSKTDLYMAVVEGAQAELVPRYREAIAGAKSAREALRALLYASDALHRGDPSLSAFLSAVPVELKRHEEIAAAMAAQPSEVLSIVVQIVEDGVRSGEVPAEREADVVAMFVACTMGLSLYGASIDDAALPGAIDAFVALIDGTLLRAPARRSGKKPVRRSRAGS